MVTYLLNKVNLSEIRKIAKILVLLIRFQHIADTQHVPIVLYKEMRFIPLR
jgi:hypothetical protein